MERKFYIVLISMSVIPVLLLAALYYDSVTDGIEQHAVSNFQLEAEVKSREIGTYLKARRQRLKTMAELRIFGVALEYERFEGIEQYFNSLTSNGEEYFGLLMIDTQDQLRAFNTYGSDGIFITDARSHWNDILGRIQFHPPFSGSVRLDDDGESLLVESAPLADPDGKAIGTLVAIFRPEPLKALLAQSVERLKKLKNIAPRVTATVSANGKALTRMVVPEGAAAGDDEAVFCHEQPDADGLSVSACVEVDEEQLYAEARRLQILFPAIIGLSILLWSGLATMMVRSSLSFVSRLVSKLEELSHGDYRKLEVVGSGRTRKYERLVNDLIDRILAFQVEQDQNARLVAVGKTAQMLAHDVRKPFTVLKIALESLREQKDGPALEEAVEKLLPEVDRAMAAVNGMIVDIMEIGSKSTLELHPANPEDLILNALNEIFLIRPGGDIRLEYDLRHRRKVMVDGFKMRRVFSNILDNAVAATGPNGRIWFRTEEAGGFVRFTIGNSGSYVPPEDREQIFEAFYTRGKAGGTGLGLAIAHKIIRDHGGRIEVKSDETRGTEFVFSLPAASEPVPTQKPELPVDANAVKARFEPATRELPLLTGAYDLEAQIDGRVKERRRPIHVLIVDDEPLYRNTLEKQLMPAGGAPGRFVVAKARHADEALKLAEERPFDVIVCDVDLGPGSIDGLALVEELRRRGSTAFICIHSNLSLPEFYKTSIERGADAFIPKPMSREHLLGFVLKAAQRRPTGVNEGSESEESREYALVEDNPFVRAAWQQKARRHRLHVFPSPGDFWRAVEGGELDLSRLAFVVIDNRFETDEEDGLSFARHLKQRYRGPIVMSSNYEFTDAELNGAVDITLPKHAHTYDEVMQLIDLRKTTA